jgi:trimeric autotransporter adhesin
LVFTRKSPMNPAVRFLVASVLPCICFVAGCGGGGGSTAATSPTPSSNPVPAITAITPSSAVAGATDTSVTIRGSGFISSSTVQWNGAPIATTYSSATTLIVPLPASSLTNGTIAKITVANPSPGGGASPSVDFPVNNPVPAISKINPASVLAGSGDTLLDVSGTGFVPSTLIAWNGAVLTTTFVSATELKAALPAASLSGSSASLVTIQNPAPGGGSSAAVTFDVNSPAAVITAISPRIVPPGTAATITITGTGFESNSVVLWNGSARPTTFMSATILRVALTAADLQIPGLDALTVNNPGPGASTSSAAQLTVTPQPIPVITSVSVSTSPAASGVCSPLQVAITGQNFEYNSTIQANVFRFKTSCMGVISQPSSIICRWVLSARPAVSPLR